jgi:hypothetical protein
LRDEYTDGAASNYQNAFAEYRSQLANGANGYRGRLGQGCVPDVKTIRYGDQPVCPAYHVLGKSTVDVLSCHDEFRAEAFRVSLAPVAATASGHHIDNDVRARRRA